MLYKDFALVVGQDELEVRDAKVEGWGKIIERIASRRQSTKPYKFYDSKINCLKSVARTWKTFVIIN